MIRTGYVVSLTGDLAKVQLDDLNCSRCASGQGCAILLIPRSATNAVTSVQCANAVGVIPGDRVEINFDVSIFNKLRVYSAYLLPIVGLLAGAIAGTVIGSLMGTVMYWQLSTNSQLLPSLGAIVGFVGGVLAYPSYNCEQHAADLQGLNPRISRLLKKGGYEPQQQPPRMVR